MAKLFDVLRKLNELDTAELDTKEPCKSRVARCNDIVEMNMRKQGDHITMGTPTGTLHKLNPMFGQSTHAAILFIIDRTEYERVNGMLDDAPVVSITEEELKALSEKAAKWDALDEKIGKVYLQDEEAEDEDGLDRDLDLCEIGEMAARAFGYL